jgi:hypothetical protein
MGSRGQRLVQANSARLGGDAGFKLQKRRAGSLPVEFCAQAGKLFKQGVDGCAQSAGEQAALVASVEPPRANLGSHSQSDDG